MNLSDEIEKIRDKTKKPKSRLGNKFKSPIKTNIVEKSRNEKSMPTIKEETERSEIDENVVTVKIVAEEKKVKNSVVTKLFGTSFMLAEEGPDSPKGTPLKTGKKKKKKKKKKK